MRATPTDIEARTFPKSSSLLRSEPPVPPIPPLSSLSVSAQHLVLLRDLLLVLAGVEGQHIRVAAATSTTEERPDERFSGRGASAFKNQLKVCDISLMLDVDSADRSTVSQVDAPDI